MTRTFKVANGDWVLDRRTGQPTMLSGQTKLRQDIQENLTIAVQRNGFGAGLDTYLGKDVDPIAFRIEMTRVIRASITTLQRLQDRYLRRYRTSSERISNVTSLTVTNATINGAESKVSYAFRLVVKPVAGESVTVAGTAVGGGGV